MSHAIEGKVVVITGATSGIGEAAAHLLAKGGAKLMLGARRIAWTGSKLWRGTSS